MLSKEPNRPDTSPVLTDSAKVYERIRADILRCKLAPDARLQMDDLRTRYEVGLSPLREALMRLEADGMVVLVQNKGFRVAPVSREHLLDLGRMRASLEGMALRSAIEHGDVAWEADILSSFHRLSRQNKIVRGSQSRISEEWSREHRIFHASLIAASNSPILKSILGTLFDQAERYIALSIANRAVPRDDLNEHERIMTATLARDADKACSLSRRHIDLTTAKVAASIRI